MIIMVMIKKLNLNLHNLHFFFLDPTERTQRGEEFYCDKEFFSGVSRDNFETEHDEENNLEEPTSPALSGKSLIFNSCTVLILYILAYKSVYWE